MNGGPHGSSNKINSIQDLSKGVENGEECGEGCKRGNGERSPWVHCSINQNKYIAIVDTGAQISRISDRAYNEIKGYTPITELPAVGIRITGPTYNKPIIIKKQIYVPLKIGSYCSETVLFVIPHLTVEIILGTDWLTRNDAIINYIQETIVLKNKFSDKEVVLFGKNRLGNTKMDNINILISSDIVVKNDNKVNRNMENHVKYDEENNNNYAFY